MESLSFTLSRLMGADTSRLTDISLDDSCLVLPRDHARRLGFDQARTRHIFRNTSKEKAAAKTWWIRMACGLYFRRHTCKVVTSPTSNGWKFKALKHLT